MALTPGSAGDLFVISILGKLADEFLLRDLEPTLAQMEILKGDVEISMRSLSSLCVDLDLRPAIELFEKSND